MAQAGSRGRLAMTPGRFRGRPHLGTLQALVDELTILPEDHLALCFLMLLIDCPTLRRAFPKLGLTPANADALVRLLVRFALAGLAAVAAEARQEAWAEPVHSRLG